MKIFKRALCVLIILIGLAGWLMVAVLSSELNRYKVDQAELKAGLEKHMAMLARCAKSGSCIYQGKPFQLILPPQK